MSEDWTSFRRPTPPCGISCQLRHRHLVQAHPFEKPGVWPSLRAMTFDVGLAVLFWIGLLAGLYWLMTR